ncbi:MAG TPA: DUF6575 domain-containing protein [Acidimicrobiales bacterium]|nr:DUF6575 domain-containing protein [Acidimicrobiales bacterium]
MNPLVSFGVEIDEVLDWHDGPSLFTGHDRDGRHYLAVQVAGTPMARRWMFAAISTVALRCVLIGDAEIRDAFRHSLTGYIETVSIDRAGRVTGSMLLCTELSDDLLPDEGERLALAA